MLKRVVLALAATGAVVSSAGAQVFRVRVTTEAGQPVPQATVNLLTLRDSVIGVGTTSTVGIVLLTAPRPGFYGVDARRIGLVRGYVSPVSAAHGDTVNVNIQLFPPAAVMDTIVTQGRRSIFGVTAPQEFIRRHMLWGRGEIVTGAEMQRSGLSVGEYIARLPGLEITTAPGIQLVIPIADGKFIQNRHGAKCLFARVDRTNLPFRLIANSDENLDVSVRMSEVMAVEIYRSRDEIPPEWRQYSTVGAPQILPRKNGGTPYIMGGLHEPTVTAETIALDEPAYQTTFAMRGINIPLDCGYVQIWTKAAW
jgi:hypothetical protein